MSTNGILEAILSILSIILTAFVVPLLNKKLGTEKVKQASAQFDAYVALAEKVVAAAKQKAELVTGPEMKAYAETTLKSLGVPESVLEVVIEAAVNGLKIAETTIDAAQTLDAAVQNATEANT